MLRGLELIAASRTMCPLALAWGVPGGFAFELPPPNAGLLLVSSAAKKVLLQKRQKEKANCPRQTYIEAVDGVELEDLQEYLIIVDWYFVVLALDINPVHAVHSRIGESANIA